jgi:hypothetical protein
MGFFSRSSSEPANPVFSGQPADLVRIATQAFGGQSPNPPGISGIPVGELDAYAMAALSAFGYPAGDTPAWSTMQERFLDELTATADRGGEWAFPGAMCVAWNVVGPEVDDLGAGESRKLAETAVGNHLNVIFAQRRSGGLAADSYEAFLRELGDRLGTPSFWAHDDLAPYLPCRAKSRDAMRIEARAAVL